jgi:hypothetical protein
VGGVVGVAHRRCVVAVGWHHCLRALSLSAVVVVHLALLLLSSSSAPRAPPRERWLAGEVVLSSLSSICRRRLAVSTRDPPHEQSLVMVGAGAELILLFSRVSVVTRWISQAVGVLTLCVHCCACLPSLPAFIPAPRSRYLPLALLALLAVVHCSFVFPPVCLHLRCRPVLSSLSPGAVSSVDVVECDANVDLPVGSGEVTSLRGGDVLTYLGVVELWW